MNPWRRLFRRLALLAALLLGTGLAQAASPVQQLGQATLRELGPSPGSARAQTLPLHWDIEAPGREAQVELRLAFERPAHDQPEPWSLLVPRLGNAWLIELNGERLASGGEVEQANGAWAAKRPLWLALPEVLLKPHNELRFVLRLDNGRRGGLSRVSVGPTSALQAEWLRQEWLRVTLPQAASVLSLLVAGFCLMLWLQQHDPLYAWAALGEAAWGLRLADTWWEASPLPWPWWGLAVLLLFWVWSGALYQLVRALWGGARPVREQRAIHTILLLGPPCFALAWWLQAPVWVVAWMLVSMLSWTWLTLRLGVSCWRRPERARMLVVLAIGLCLAALARDIYAGRASALHFEDTAWAKYAAITLALAVLLIVGQRFKQAREALLALNASVQHRLAEREAELNLRHRQLTALERDKAAADERTRILRDMHDGAGAHLIAAIHQVQSGEASRDELLHSLQASLDQLRLSVDAMHLPNGDINALLSSLRFRLEPRLQAAQLALRWRADELPLLAHYQASDMRHLQFILLEAISNVVQHAHATQLAVSARADSTHIVLELHDDGVGLGNGQGNGQRNMRERAALIGAGLLFPEVHKGTCLRLNLARLPD